MSHQVWDFVVARPEIPAYPNSHIYVPEASGQIQVFVVGFGASGGPVWAS